MLPWSVIGGGVVVPGVKVEKEGKELGLLFADDLVAFGCCRVSLQADHISEWCRKWEMKRNVGPCV